MFFNKSTLSKLVLHNNQANNITTSYFKKLTANDYKGESKFEYSITTIASIVGGAVIAVIIWAGLLWLAKCVYGDYTLCSSKCCNNNKENEDDSIEVTGHVHLEDATTTL